MNKKISIPKIWKIDMCSDVPAIEKIKDGIEEIVAINTFEALTEYINSLSVEFYLNGTVKSGLDIGIYSDLEYDEEINGESFGNSVGVNLPLESLLGDLRIPQSKEQRKGIEKAIIGLEDLAKNARKKYLTDVETPETKKDA